MEPHGCHCISVQSDEWWRELLDLARQRLTVIFDLQDMSVVLELEAELTELGYEHLILAWNCRKHFLVPIDTQVS
jgi:hypothetical protein